MATIDFGYLSDLDCDTRTTTTIVIPDAGPLPELPPAVAEEFGAAAVAPVAPTWGPPSGWGGASVKVVKVGNGKAAGPPVRSLWLFYAPARQEWVCLDSERDWHDWSYAGDFRFGGPYRAPDHLLQKVLEALQVPPGKLQAAAARQVSPDKLAELGRASGCT
jgi:hypothetical protein